MNILGLSNTQLDRAGVSSGLLGGAGVIESDDVGLPVLPGFFGLGRLFVSFQLTAPPAIGLQLNVCLDSGTRPNPLLLAGTKASVILRPGTRSSVLLVAGTVGSVRLDAGSQPSVIMLAGTKECVK